MKHIKTFESFLNEAVKYNPKPFDQVKAGNTAHVIGSDDAWEVLATGLGADFKSKLQKYDVSGVVSSMMQNPRSYGMDRSEWEELELIAVKHEAQVEVYTYGDDGAWVNK
jgi:hypothetical protein